MNIEPVAQFSVGGNTPFKLASRVMFSISLIWFTSLAVYIGWVNWNKLPVETHMEKLIGYYVDHAPSKGFVEKLAIDTYLAALMWFSAAITLIASCESSPNASVAAAFVKPGDAGELQHLRLDLRASSGHAQVH
ncbi:MAG: hypothetical protein Q7K57_09625 [Burkholderiaceae bacterium]|nr:hypothetical protein [Burkholderiaceae bacterium]